MNKGCEVSVCLSVHKLRQNSESNRIDEEEADSIEAKGHSADDEGEDEEDQEEREEGFSSATSSPVKLPLQPGSIKNSNSRQQVSLFGIACKKGPKLIETLDKLKNWFDIFLPLDDTSELLWLVKHPKQNFQTYSTFKDMTGHRRRCTSGVHKR